MLAVSALSTVQLFDVYAGEAEGVFCWSQAGVVGQRVGVSPGHVD